MAQPTIDTRVPLSKAEFIQIFRWHRQMRISNLADLVGIKPAALAKFESGQDMLGNGMDSDRLAQALGMAPETWDKVGAEPGYPGSEPPATKAPAKGNGIFAEHINRIAAMPENFRVRQMQVIRKELTYIDEF